LPELLAVVVALAVPLNVTVVPLPAAAGVIVPEMVNVCGEGVEEVLVLCPLMKPEQPQRQATVGSTIATSSARRARELIFNEPASWPIRLLYPENLIAQAPRNLPVR
jgi:hypothetical protein